MNIPGMPQMTDEACVRFLQWALPRLQMRWPGFRKVRRQVRKRIIKRLGQLGLPDVSAYHSYLEQNPSEWLILDTFFRITISRFFRDKAVFTQLGEIVLPALTTQAKDKGDAYLRCWCAGCASGEEAYSLALLWHFIGRQNRQDLKLEITATDIDGGLLERAATAEYTASSLHELPKEWVVKSFKEKKGKYVLRSNFRGYIHFSEQDIRKETPEGPFHLIMCRNLVFTYFDTILQRDILSRIETRLLQNGALIIGIHETLPEYPEHFTPWLPHLPIFRKKITIPTRNQKQPD